MSQTPAMTNESRRAIYREQGGYRAELTPAQERRIRKAGNKAIAEARLMPDGTLIPRLGRLRRRLDRKHSRLLRANGREWVAMVQAMRRNNGKRPQA